MMKQQQLQNKGAMGLRIQGEELKQQMIQFDSTFQKIPIAHAVGIPLYVKRLMNEPKKKGKCYIIVRMMSEPSVGLAPQDWQYGGLFGPAPPVLVGRKDSVQFNLNDWAVLDDFQMEMLDDGPRKVKRKDFVKYVKKHNIKQCNIVLEALYPKGASCLIIGLIQNQELNGKVGVCNGNYLNDRLGVQISETKKSYAIRPQNLKAV